MTFRSASSALALALFCVHAPIVAMAQTNLLDGSSAQCLPAERVKSLAKHFKQFGKFTKTGVCVDKNPVEHRLLHMLITLEDVRVNAPAQPSGDDLSLPILPANWIDYLKSSVRELLPAKSGSCYGSTIAYVIVGGKNNVGKMYYCPKFIDSRTEDLFDQIAVFLHETRHLEGDYPHVTCTQGPRKGNDGGCDESPAVKGAYLVTIEALAKISAFGENVHPSAREASRASALAYAFEAFNKPPKIDRMEKPLLLSKSGELQLLGKKDLVTKREEVPVGFMARRLNYGYDVFPSDTSAKAISLSPGLSFVQPDDEANGFVSSFNDWPAKFRGEIRGAHYGEVMDVWLEANRAVVYCRGEKETARKEFPLAKDTYTNLIYPEGYDPMNARAAVLAKSGKWADIRCSSSGKPELDWHSSSWKGPARVMKVADRVLGIEKDGKLVEKSGSKWKPVPEAKDHSFVEILSYDWIRYLDER
jgi:hypothetical protein